MIDASQILEDLQRQARAALDEFDVDQKLDDAKDAAGKVRQRLEADPDARKAAAGAGGLLLLGLLGTNGGRRLMGDVAKTGVVAALGALAYKAWNERRGPQEGERSRGETPPEFVIDADADPDFALALIRAMIAGAYADGALSDREETIIRKVVDEGGFDNDAVQGLLVHDYSLQDDIDALAAMASTPNRAAQLYAAAALTADRTQAKSKDLLDNLAKRLGVDPAYAAALDAQ